MGLKNFHFIQIFFSLMILRQLHFFRLEKSYTKEKLLNILKEAWFVLHLIENMQRQISFHVGTIFKQRKWSLVISS